MKELLQKALDKWGTESQLDMAIEECSELITAIQHHRRGRVGVPAIVEECVDVELMLEQMKLVLNAPTLWEEIKKQKLERLSKLLANPLPL